MSKGCTIGLIILAVLVVIIIIGIIILWANKEKIINASIDYIVTTAETQIIQNMPDGYTEDQVHQIMGDLKAAIKDGRTKPQDVQMLAHEFQTDMDDKVISKEEGAKLLAMIKAMVYGTGAPEDTLPEMPSDSMQLAPDSI